MGKGVGDREVGARLGALLLDDKWIFTCPQHATGRTVEALTDLLCFRLIQILL